MKYHSKAELERIEFYSIADFERIDNSKNNKAKKQSNFKSDMIYITKIVFVVLVSIPILRAILGV